MAYIEIHSIKSSVSSSVRYIRNPSKTDSGRLITTFKCTLGSAHIQFNKIREHFSTRGTILARHIIQSFLPNQLTPEIAHEIGLRLCKEILKDNHEFILCTHIDTKHIHNHILFNNVSIVTGKCYKLNRQQYLEILRKNNNICKEYNLSIIKDVEGDYYKTHTIRGKTGNKSWYEYKHLKNGTSWKQWIREGIDKSINISNTWEGFISNLLKMGYEIKQEKCILFKHKDVDRFVTGRTLGTDYEEERIKERILSKQIYIAFDSKDNFKSQNQLEETIKSYSLKIQILQNEIQKIDNQISSLSNDIKYINIVKFYHHLYKQNDIKNHKSEILLYQNAILKLKNKYPIFPICEELIEKLKILNNKRIPLIKEYYFLNSQIKELYKTRKEFEKSIVKNIKLNKHK